uniref:Poly [ADP-ribose] polymerase n=1 Tax=Scleropages formosus TaxID=113540 RepID=A0A8C9RTG0_SCLFO
SSTFHSLVQEVFTIDRPGSLRYFTGPGREYLQVVGRTHRCLVQLRGSGIPEEPSYQLEGGMCVRVQHGNITQEKADALVNAANEDLEHRGGVAQALSLAGGPEVQQACRELVRRSGKVPTGTAVATTPAGALACKIIVHICANKDLDLVKKLCGKVLKFCEHKGYRSVAFPAVCAEYNPPSCWDPMAPGESIKKVLLEQDSPEYRDVAQNFLRTATGHTIHKIERVQNIHLWRSYWGKMQQFTEKNGVGQVGEKFLYHGTSVAACDSIKREGFNRSFAGKHATRHGVGVYFAVHASYSASLAFTPPDQAGLRYMYVARVLTGHYTVGTEDMKVPPLRSGTNPPDRFDSLVNAANNPSMFVIFHDDQAYPDYLITFK